MINTRESMERFEWERNKLNLPSIEIKFLEIPNIEDYGSLLEWWSLMAKYSTKAVKQHDGTFYVQFNPLSYRNSKEFKKNARHELYHIYSDGHLNKIGLGRRIFSELGAMLYEYLGMKI